MSSADSREGARKDIPEVRVSLDSSLYSPTPEEVAFLKSQTRIRDDEELKQHIIAVQREAWNVSSRSHLDAAIATADRTSACH